MNNKPHQRLLDGMPPHIAEKVDKMIGNMTAVEWLKKEINNEDHHTEGELGNSCIDVNTLLILIEQAKQMEKEQIVDAHIEGQRVFDKHPHTQWTNDQAEQYYNETYEK